MRLTKADRCLLCGLVARSIRETEQMLVRVGSGRPVPVADRARLRAVLEARLGALLKLWAKVDPV